MPFTPFHFGPASLVKAVVPGYFSISAFMLVQVVIDIESLYNMIHDRYPVHSYLHSYVGSTIVALLVMVSCALFVSLVLANWNKYHGRSPDSRLNVGSTITWKSAAFGAFIGAYSHVALDSIMHSDIHPYWPFSDLNHLYLVVSVPVLHLVCFVFGAVGFTWLLHLLLIGRYRA